MQNKKFAFEKPDPDFPQEWEVFEGPVLDFVSKKF